MPKKVEIEHRLDRIRRMQAAGKTDWQIRELVCQEWGISQRRIGWYLKKAKERGIACMEQPIEMFYLDLFLKFEQVYEGAIGMGKLQEARNTLESQNKLLGDYGKYLQGNPVLSEKLGHVSLKLLERVFCALAKGHCSYCGK